ncbi:ABC transporter permease [Aureimonas pseudogalii]|uniref:Iron complex transport system permease protein n=1 Tax=Aureimonas pseudogalii TaxID=1744844 RepID=A0A7W6H6X7_9HYPH|nr:iron chelate uptake ABC transporter family permease subunit [Aureimonas pseudogalii]MBB3999563.1 iron complex transport system permease protein [Aureimonas pseudogalii]
MPIRLLAALAICALAVASLFVGVSEVTPAALLDPASSARAFEILWASRVPRTLALILAGVSLAVAGLLMQMLTRNRFVEPSTAGTVESASLGMLAATLLLPEASILTRMLVSAGFALAGTALFLRILARVPLRSPLVVPLVGLMLGGVLSAVTTFLAYRYDLMQALAAWTTADFSVVLRGRYELLWIAFALALAAYVAADRFTVAGMGEDFTTNLGLDYRRLMVVGLVIVSLVTASVVSTVGIIPFLGLVVPNVVSLFAGDNMRRTLPWVAALGAALVLACDLIGRVIRPPYEIPVGTVFGVVGSAVFLALLLNRRARVA